MHSDITRERINVRIYNWKNYFWWYEKNRIAWNIIYIITLYSSKVNNWVTCRNPTDRDAILVLLHLTLTPSSPDPEQLQGYKSRSFVNKRNSKEYRHFSNFMASILSVFVSSIKMKFTFGTCITWRCFDPLGLNIVQIDCHNGDEGWDDAWKIYHIKYMNLIHPTKVFLWLLILL